MNALTEYVQLKYIPVCDNEQLNVCVHMMSFLIM